MVSWAKGLQARGYEVDIFNLAFEMLPPKLDGYVLTHLFAAGAPQGPFLTAIGALKRQKMPIFLSPIFWPLHELNEEMAFWRIGAFVDIGTIYGWIREIIRGCDFLLPQGILEMRAIQETFLVARDKPWQIVPNTVDLGETDGPYEKFPFEKPFVLCVGRVEVRKNQYRLAQALKLLRESGLNLPLALIGRVDQAFFNLFIRSRERWDPQWVGWLGAREPRFVFGAMRACKIFAQPSFFETPGLAALEAGALGCNLVLSNRGSVREYFQDLVYYCDPKNTYEIADAIYKAYTKPKDADALRNHIRQNYTLDKAVDALLKAYREVLRF